LIVDLCVLHLLIDVTDRKEKEVIAIDWNERLNLYLCGHVKISMLIGETRQSICNHAEQYLASCFIHCFFGVFFFINRIFIELLYIFFWKTCSSTLLWRIERSPPSYIFGTMHTHHRLVWPYVSNETQQAFLSSTHFYGEIDAKDPTFWDKLLQCLKKKLTRIRRSG
jgi:hypothetical protein